MPSTFCDRAPNALTVDPLSVRSGGKTSCALQGGVRSGGGVTGGRLGGGPPQARSASLLGNF